MQDSMIGDTPRPNNPSGWLTFNQFFARELNPGLRPIANPSDNTTVTVPADCTYRQFYKIDAESNIDAADHHQRHPHVRQCDGPPERQRVARTSSPTATSFIFSSARTRTTGPTRRCPGS